MINHYDRKWVLSETQLNIIVLKILYYLRFSYMHFYHSDLYDKVNNDKLTVDLYEQILVMYMKMLKRIHSQ